MAENGWMDGWMDKKQYIIVEAKSFIKDEH